MNKRSNAVFWMVQCLFILTLSSLHAQPPALEINGTKILNPETLNGGIWSGYTIPDTETLTISVRGGDGGHVDFRGSCDVIVKGGGAAQVNATYKVGHEGAALKPNGTILGFLGTRGMNADPLCSNALLVAGGGGGASVVLYLPPGADLTGRNWVILAVAGGGGGAARPIVGNRNIGGGAKDTEQGGRSGDNQGGDDSICPEEAPTWPFFPAGIGAGMICRESAQDAHKGRDLVASARYDSGNHVIQLVPFTPLNILNTAGLSVNFPNGGFGFFGGGAAGEGGGGGGGFYGGAVSLYNGGGGGGSYVNDRSYGVTNASRTRGADGGANNLDGEIIISTCGGSKAVCKLDEIKVELNSNGQGALSIDEVDNGSILSTCLGDGSKNLRIGSMTYTDTYAVDCGTASSFTAILEVRDFNGNVIDQCSSTITVEDNIPPQLTCKAVTSLSLDENDGTATLNPLNLISNVSEACDIASYNLSQSEFSCDDLGEKVVSMTVTDVDGNLSNSCDVIVFIESPFEIIPVDLGGVNLEANGEVILFAEDLVQVTAHGCDDKVVSFDDGQSSKILTCENLGLNTFDIRVSDPNDQVVGFSLAAATILDNTPPQLSCKNANPGALLQVDLKLVDGTASLEPSMLIDDVTEACGIASYNWSQSEFTCDDIGWHEVTLTATDESGNVSNTCAAEVHVQLPNTINVNPVTNVSLEANGERTINAIDLVRTDLLPCEVLATFANGEPSRTFNCNDIGTVIDIIQVSTLDGQVLDYFDVQFKVNDNTSPQLTCETFTFITLDQNNGSVTLDPLDLITNGTDACSIASYDLSQSQFSCDDLGVNMVSLTAQDPSGNVSNTCMVEVVVIMSVAPIEVNTSPISLGADGEKVLLAQDLAQTSGLLCDNVIVTFEDGQSSKTVTCADIGSFEIVDLLVSTPDGFFLGLASTQLIVKDELAPTPLCQPINIQLKENGTASIEAVQLDNGSTDNCSITSYSADQTTFDCTDIGTQTVILTVQDASNNSASCPAIVTVEDHTPLTAECREELTVVLDENTSTATIEAAELDDGSSAGCSALEFSTNITTFDCSNIGPNTVTLTVKDEDNNSASCTTNVTVREDIAPTAICQNTVVLLDDAGNGTLTADKLDGGSWDACSDVTFSFAGDQQAFFFDCTDIGANTINAFVMNAEDESGNISICAAFVSVKEEVPPVAVCQDVTVHLNQDGIGIFDSGSLENGSTDNCGVVSPVGDLEELLFCESIGSFVDTLTVRDESGNQSTCTGMVTVVDEIAPTPLCQNISVQLDKDGFASIDAIQLDNESKDNCSIASYSASQTTFDCSDIGTKTVTLTVTDGSNNSASCPATVTVEDNIAPIAICQPVTVTIGNNGLASVSATQIDNGSSDACGLANLSLSQQGFDCSQVGDHTVTLTATDLNGNASQCQTTVTVKDEMIPKAVCQDHTVMLDGDGEVTIAASIINNESSDNCPNLGFSLSQTTFDCSHIGANPVTLTATDASGNAATCEATVTVLDDMPPQLTCKVSNGNNNNNNNNNNPTSGGENLIKINLTLPEGGQASLSPNDLIDDSSDNCGIAAYDLSQSAFTCDDLGMHTVTLTATDASGNTSNTCSARVEVKIPVPATYSNINTLYLDEQGMLTINARDLVQTGDLRCDNLITTFQDGQTTKTFSCTDIGQVDLLVSVSAINGTVFRDAEFSLTVKDTTGPDVQTQDIEVFLDSSSQASISASDIDNGSTDNCGIASYALDQTTFDCSALGEHTVTLTVIDVHGNSSSSTAKVTVVDVLTPTALCQPISIQLGEDGTASIAATQLDNSSTDDCSIVSYAASQTSFDCTDLGTQTVTLTVQDASNNAASCEATVTVTDEIAPVLNCPQDMTVNTDLGECGAYVTLPKAAPSDNCGIKNLKSRYRPLDEAGSPIGSWSAWDNDQSGFFEVGSYQIQWRAKDHSNNKGFCSFQLDIVDQEAPTVNCKDLTINFNGEETIAIEAASIFNENTSFDACGTVSFVSQSVSEVSCESVGETLSVEVVGVDPNGNTTNCFAEITVEGMSCGFEVIDINCPDGAAASYDPLEESFTLSADDCSGYPEGEFSFVGTELCGDGEIVANIAQLIGDGRAGVMMMEDKTPGARFVSKIKDLSPRTRTEYRSSTGGNISHKNKNRSGVKWLRIVREGTKFKTYTSTNGSYWRHAHTINFPSFAECIYAGLVVYSKSADTPVNAVFKHVTITGDSDNAFTVSGATTPQVVEGLGVQQAVESRKTNDPQFAVAPNPFTTQTQVDFSLSESAAVTLEVYNLHGQPVQTLEQAQLEAGTYRYKWDGMDAGQRLLPSGVYLIQLRKGKEVYHQKVMLQRL